MVGFKRNHYISWIVYDNDAQSRPAAYEINLKSPFHRGGWRSIKYAIVASGEYDVSGKT